MAEARKLKQREYNTNIVAHDNLHIHQESQNLRNTNTFKSNAFQAQGQSGSKPSYHEQIFTERPLANQVTRASY
jgi:hypothetical protein